MNFFQSLNHVFIIAEAGSNWKCGSYEEDLQQAKKLIDVAVKSGADAVKFQTYRPETIYVENAGNSDYLSKGGISQSINEIFKNLSMPYEMLPELEKYCKNNKIMFMSTPFSVNDAKEVDPFVEIHKIASFEINHIRLIEVLAETKKPMIISTGASTFEEIDFVINLIKEKGNQNISLLQCTSQYPCSIESLNLAVIPKLNDRYNLPIGLSDHSTDPIVGPMTATSLGAKIIEKHFTLDKKLPGPDHAFALEPSDLELMIQSIRNVEKSMGSGIKTILDEEKELRQFATRSIQAIKDIKKGDKLIEGDNFDILRPGNRIRGLDAKFLNHVQGKTSKVNVMKGDGILEILD